MKIIIGFLILLSSFYSLSLRASESFECDFFGPNYTLSFQDSGAILLFNEKKELNCLKDYTNYPGTELSLQLLKCKEINKSKKEIIFYFTQLNSETVILSKNFVSGKDIYCKKIN